MYCRYAILVAQHPNLTSPTLTLPSPPRHHPSSIPTLQRCPSSSRYLNNHPLTPPPALLNAMNNNKKLPHPKVSPRLTCTTSHASPLDPQQLFVPYIPPSNQSSNPSPLEFVPPSPLPLHLTPLPLTFHRNLSHPHPRRANPEKHSQ